MKEETIKKNELIASEVGWILETNFPPNSWAKGSDKINSIGFHKSKLFGRLIEAVDYLEQKHSLYIIIKRRECIIQKMNLCRSETIIHKEANTKQEAVWLAVTELLTLFKNRKK